MSGIVACLGPICLRQMLEEDALHVCDLSCEQDTYEGTPCTSSAHDPILQGMTGDLDTSVLFPLILRPTGVHQPGRVLA